VNATTALAVVLAVLSAACYAAGAVAQERVSARTSSGTSAGRGFGWWLALGGNGVGALLHVLALRYGTLSIVQPLGALTLVFALPLAALATRRLVRRAEWQGAGLAVVGLGILLLLVPAGASTGALRSGQVYGLVTVVVAAVALATVWARLVIRPVLRGVLYGVASGVVFALASALTQTVAVQVAEQGPGALVSSATGLMVAAAAGGVLLSQAAYRAGGLAVPLIAVTLANPVAAALIGMVLLGEGYAGGAGGAALAMAAAALTVRGVLMLAVEPARTAAPVSTVTTRPSALRSSRTGASGGTVAPGGAGTLARVSPGPATPLRALPAQRSGRRRPAVPTCPAGRPWRAYEGRSVTRGRPIRPPAQRPRRTPASTGLS